MEEAAPGCHAAARTFLVPREGYVDHLRVFLAQSFDLTAQIFAFFIAGSKLPGFLCDRNKLHKHHSLAPPVRELLQEGIDHAVIPDSASARYLGDGVGLVITGADRIAANGDFANKIGTLDKAILARHFGVPFYVAAPISTFDPNAADGRDIPTEYRTEEEVTCLGGQRLAPVGSRALNPAFDVTPGSLVTGFITESGIIPPGPVPVHPNEL